MWGVEGPRVVLGGGAVVVVGDVCDLRWKAAVHELPLPGGRLCSHRGKLDMQEVS